MKILNGNNAFLIITSFVSFLIMSLGSHQRMETIKEKINLVPTEEVKVSRFSDFIFGPYMSLGAHSSVAEGGRVVFDQPCPDTSKECEKACLKVADQFNQSCAKSIKEELEKSQSKLINDLENRNKGLLEDAVNQNKKSLISIIEDKESKSITRRAVFQLLVTFMLLFQMITISNLGLKEGKEQLNSVFNFILVGVLPWINI